MQRIVLAVLLCGTMLFLTTGCPSGGGGDDKEIKLEKGDLSVKAGDKATMKVKEGKAKSAEAPADSKLKASTTATEVTVDAKDAKKGGPFDVKVKGEKGDATLKVTVTD